MKSSDGSRYKALFKKGSENKALIYFAGGGVSINEETVKGYFLFQKPYFAKSLPARQTKAVKQT